MSRFMTFARIVMAFAAAFLVINTASAQTWKMATKHPPESMEGKSFREFATLVNQYTSGKLKIEIFPSEQLGKDDATLEQLGAGIIHIWPEGPDYLSKWAPELAYVFAPFIFESRDHWLRFMSTDLVKGWLQRVEEKGGVTVIGGITEFPRGPYRVMSSKRSVRSLADMKGLKLRMFPNELVVDAYAHLGAEVRVLAWTEVYESLGRGIIEAVTLPISLVEDMRFYEQASFVVRTDEFHQSVAFMVNAAAYKGLDPAVRQAVNRALTDSAALQRQRLAGSIDASIDRLKGKKAQFVTANTSEFVERMRGFYEQREKSGKLPSGFMAAVLSSR
jgi:TRAP-type C4-dicarboxylate transport system substrate-binding protein